MSLANLRPPPWTENAACRDQPTDPLTAAHLQPHHWDDAGTPAARRVCADCPVQLNCAQHALATAEPRGMWGGLDPHDRRRIANGTYGHHGIDRPGAARHGTRSRYQAGCRCTGNGSCTEAMRRWKADYVARRADTRPARISA